MVFARVSAKSVPNSRRSFSQPGYQQRPHCFLGMNEASARQREQNDASLPAASPSSCVVQLAMDSGNDSWYNRVIQPSSSHRNHRVPPLASVLWEERPMTEGFWQTSASGTAPHEVPLLTTKLYAPPAQSRHRFIAGCDDGCALRCAGPGASIAGERSSRRCHVYA